MGDEKYYTIQVKGTAYRFQPMPDDDITMVVTVISMGVGLQHSLKALAGPLSASLGEDQWSAFISRMVAKELTATDMTKAFQTLLKRQTADKAKAKGPKAPAAADDAE
jgi:hypothetical protein